jgi:hypothetical protein
MWGLTPKGGRRKTEDAKYKKKTKKKAARERGLLVFRLFFFRLSGEARR